MTFLHALSGSSRPSGPRHRIVPSVPRPLALEARFMFDGAAAAEVVEAVAEHADHCDEGLQPLTSPRITQAYAVDTSKTPGTFNQNSHTFTNNAITVKSVEVDTTPGSGFGNDILASITRVINGNDTTYFGWISRQIKDGSETQGLYFWTDKSFTSAQAALDGYKDQSKDPDENNQAFILALGTKWEGEARSFTEKSSSDIKTKDWETDACDEQDNRAPTASNDTASGDEDTDVSGHVLLNDTDPDSGDTALLTVTGFTVAGDPTSYTSGETATIAGKGTLTLNADGTFTFTPALNFNGPVSGITYTVSDGKGGTSTANVTVNVNSVNDAPVAEDDTATTNEDTAITFGVKGNDSDVDGDLMTVTGFTVAGDSTSYTSGETATIDGQGTLTLNADGTFTFTPALNFNGPVSGITYTVSDGKGGRSTASVTVNVNSVNDAPTPTDDTVSTPANTSITFSVKENDSDPDDDVLTVTDFTVVADNGVGIGFTVGETATIDGQGTLTLNANGTFTFTPALNFNGPVSGINYTVSDGNLTDSARLTLEVTPPPPEPLVVPPPPPPPLIELAPTAPPLMESFGGGGSGGAAAARASFVPPPRSAAERNLVVRTSIREFEVEPHMEGTRLQRFDSAIRPLQYGTGVAPDHLIEPPTRHVHHIDTHTDAPDNDWRTVVHPDTRSQLAVWRGISDQRVDTDDVAYVSVPWDSFSHTHSDAQVTLDATLADGSPLPLWMNLDARAGVFELVPPPGLEAELAIRLIARDAEGREAATLFRIQVGERARVLNDGAAPTGRAGLSEQLREATRQSATSRLALPPQYMTAPTPHFASHPS